MINCSVLGLGYIGLPTSIVLAKSGFVVSGIDIKKDIVNKLNKGIIHIKEPGLEDLLNEVIKNKSFRAESVLKESDIFIIAVPTPLAKNSGNNQLANIKYVLEAAKSISKCIKAGNLVIIESTSPVGTTEKVLDILCKYSGLRKNQFYLSYCPERVLPGKIFHEIINNNRIIGGINKDSAMKTKEIYSKFCRGQIELTDCKTAELVKLTENAFRDVNLAFANELSIVCNKFDIDVYELIRHANLHPRVEILQPGCGVGGHCIAIDPMFIASSAPEITPLIQTARKVNKYKTNWVINYICKKVLEYEKENLEKPIVGCFGLTFKPDIDDIRESPALKIVTELSTKGLNIIACEPNLQNNFSFKLLSAEELLKEADICVILVGHSQFKKLDFQGKKIIDFFGISKNLEYEN